MRSTFCDAKMIEKQVLPVVHLLIRIVSSIRLCGDCELENAGTCAKAKAKNGYELKYFVPETTL